MSLQPLVERFGGRRIVVLGDLIADIFIYGEITRVSREAPVLILSHNDTRLVPGGAGNAVHNLAALGAEPVPVAVVGDDESGNRLIDYFERLGVDAGGIRKLRSYETPSKTRIMAGVVHAYRQQVLRIDRGQPLRSGTGARTTLRSLKARMRNADAVLISDYGYGLVEPALVAELQAASVPVTLDSRFDLKKHRGLTAATPNESEVEAALGLSIGSDLTKLERAGRTLLRRLGHEAILITRGREGMALFEKGRQTRHIPIYGGDELTDVTGAGDTVISVFSLALASGGTFEEATRLANYAGGIVVMKHGTRTLSRAELEEAVASEGA